VKHCCELCHVERNQSSELLDTRVSKIGFIGVFFCYTAGLFVNFHSLEPQPNLTQIPSQILSPSHFGRHDETTVWLTHDCESQKKASSNSLYLIRKPHSSSWGTCFYSLLSESIPNLLSALLPMFSSFCFPPRTLTGRQNHDVLLHALLKRVLWRFHGFGCSALGTS